MIQMDIDNLTTKLTEEQMADKVCSVFNTLIAAENPLYHFICPTKEELNPNSICVDKL